MKEIDLTSRKFYRQLKPTPECKEGAIFISNYDTEIKKIHYVSLYGDANGDTIWYDAENVEKNPEWFIEVTPDWVPF